MNGLLSINWFIGAAFWFVINGILHDIFVIRGHKTGYDRELLRLLMDGHVLILSGVLAAISWYMLKEGLAYGAYVGLVIAIGMIVYCLMIFPFLKSFVTLFISLALLAVCIRFLYGN